MSLLKNVLIVSFLFYLPIIATAQKLPKGKKAKKYITKIRAAEKALLNKKTDRAESLYLEVLEEKSNYIPALRGLAVVYQSRNEYDKSTEFLTEIIAKNPMYSRVVYAEAAIAFFRSGDYKKAENYFNKFAEIIKLPISEFGYVAQKEFQLEAWYARQIDEHIKACQVAKEGHFSRYLSEVYNLGAPINSSGNEYFPFLVNDGQQLYFTHKGKKHYDENLYHSFRKDSIWLEPELVDSTINTSTNEGMATFTRDGRQLFFTACQRKNVQGTCDIQTAYLKDQKIISSQLIIGDLNSNRWESQACISCGGSTLFFASSRAGGLGSTDIYFSRLQSDRTWSEPENLGPNINTPMSEEAPFITNDGKTLFFSSTGHLGLGDQDIFMSQLQENGKWGSAINLGAPINSNDRDLGFFLAGDGLTGFFSSDRPQGEGKMDIYQFDLKEKLPNKSLTYLEGFVKDAATKLPIETVLYTSDNSPIPTDVDGRFFRCFPSEEHFNFTISEKGYHLFEYAEIIPTSDNKKLYHLDILLHPIEKDFTIVEKKEDKPKIKQGAFSVFFEVDQYALTTDSQENLLEFIQNINGQNLESLTIIGFTDTTGSIDKNKILSEKRANSVANFLKQNKIKNVINLSVNLLVEGRGEHHDAILDKAQRKVEISWTIKPENTNQKK